MENHEDFQIWNPITDPRNMTFLLIHKKIKMIPEPYLKSTIYWESLGLPDTVPLINSTEHYAQHLQHVLPSTTLAPPTDAVSKVNLFSGPQSRPYNPGSRLQIISPPPPPEHPLRNTPSTSILPPGPISLSSSSQNLGGATSDELSNIFLKPETDVFDLRSAITTRSFSTSTTTTTEATVLSTTTSMNDIGTIGTDPPMTSTTQEPSSTAAPSIVLVEVTTTAMTTTSPTSAPVIEPDIQDSPASSDSNSDEDVEDPYLPSWVPPRPTSMADITTTTTSTSTTTTTTTESPEFHIAPIDNSSSQNKSSEINFDNDNEDSKSDEKVPKYVLPSEDDLPDNISIDKQSYVLNSVSTSVKEPSDEEQNNASNTVNSGRFRNTFISDPEPHSLFWTSQQTSTTTTSSPTESMQNVDDYRNLSSPTVYNTYADGLNSIPDRINASISDRESYNIM
jgi:hypothetical protein